jgi:Na+-translocating ferredoxin:NAD+ oxidoreductase subunit C
VPLSQHRGRPARPVVSVGQEVVRGEPIAVADGHLSVPMHAPATGRVHGIGLWPSAAGPREPAIVIDVYRASARRCFSTSRSTSTSDVARRDRRRPCRRPDWSGWEARPFPAT